MRPLTAEWVEKAEEDFTVALHLCRKRTSPTPNAVCFHCQQCAEKYLKALLVEAKVEAPKVHNLITLLKLVLPLHPHLEILRANLTPLNLYAVEFRYPGDSSTDDEAKVALAHSRAVRRIVRAILGLDAPPSAQLPLIKEKRARYKAKRR